MKVLFLTLMAFCAGPLLADPDSSIRPVARDNDSTEIANFKTRPQLRPISDQALPPPQVTLASVNLPLSLRPLVRPPSLEQQIMGKRRKLAKGAICGEKAIQGEQIGNVPGRLKGCGIQDAVRVRSVSGIVLSQQATMNCPTAQALRKWVDKGLTPALKSRGKVVQIDVAAHYSCRTRNNRKGAKISEHGKGRAIDISGFRMQDGSQITVSKGWNDKRTSRAMRKMHKAACGTFGTVLGPNSDKYHQDHFHLDTAKYRSGSYCK